MRFRSIVVVVRLLPLGRKSITLSGMTTAQRANTAVTIHGGDVTLTIDPTTGRWRSLHGGTTTRSWLAERSDAGLPFVNATGAELGAAIELPTMPHDAGSIGVSHRGGTRLAVSGHDAALTLELTLPDHRGPRSGLRLDLDHLDRCAIDDDPGQRDIQHALMPVMMETDPDLGWAWVAWQRHEGDLHVVAVDGPSAGWHIRYSYAGHRMEGFEILARADDVIADSDRFAHGRLPTTTRLRVHMARVGSRSEASQRAAALLDLAMAMPSATATVVGGSVALAAVGVPEQVVVERPDGSATSMTAVPEHLVLDQPGHWHIHSQRAGRTHTTRVVALADWRAFAERSIAWHREHYQLPRGAFARAVNAAGEPVGVTLAGSAFGDPDEGMSCRTGEFGGYAAWAQLLHQRAFGRDATMGESVDRYFGWLFNRGREANPGPGTLSFAAHNSHGRDYSPYHFFNEICYAQHEAWLIRQLADAIRDGHDETGEYLTHLRGLVTHYLSDHVDADGVIWNQNWPDETPVDYGTVDCPLVHLIEAWKTLRVYDAQLAEAVLTVCQRQAAHLYQRGFDFPTEGEPCTEDGSIACQAWGLAYAYNHLPDTDPAWIELATQLMAYHAKLECSGTDARVNGSSLRFWETMYETDAWGPSINAGHGWTLWSACARYELFVATGRFEHLERAWRHTGCVAARLQSDGSFPACWTPDPVPSLAHDDGWGDPQRRAEGRQTTAHAGMAFPPGASMSGMHLFVTAPQMWYRCCGLDVAGNQVVNAQCDASGDVVALTPHTPLPCDMVALGSDPQRALRITGLAHSVTVVRANGERREYTTTNGCLELPVG